MKDFDKLVLTRKILVDIFKQSGKWYASGYAFIKPNEYYWKVEELIKDIDISNNQLVEGALISGEFFIVIKELADEKNQPFITRLIKPKAQENARNSRMK